MTPGDLVGAVFGPTVVRLSSERIADFVSASGDDAARWETCAPPGFAAVLLFAVAGDFLWDERIAAHTRTLLHLDQSFAYFGPMNVDDAVRVEGTVTRARERSGSFFVTFAAAAATGHGADLLTSESTFVMSSATTGDPGMDDGEPGVTARGWNDIPPRSAAVVGALPVLRKSASRADLVRYAAATKDFNPIHWDHAAARGGGAPGVIVHGLLMLAWALQGAAAIGAEHDPIARIKARFRNALRPAEQAVVSVLADAIDETQEAPVSITVARGDVDLLTATATVRTERG